MIKHDSVCTRRHQGTSNKRRDRVSLASIMALELKALGYGLKATARNLQALGLTVSRRELLAVFTG